MREKTKQKAKVKKISKVTTSADVVLKEGTPNIDEDHC